MMHVQSTATVTEPNLGTVSRNTFNSGTLTMNIPSESQCSSLMS